MGTHASDAVALDTPDTSFAHSSLSPTFHHSAEANAAATHAEASAPKSPTRLAPGACVGGASSTGGSNTAAPASLASHAGEAASLDGSSEAPCASVHAHVQARAGVDVSCGVCVSALPAARPAPRRWARMCA